MKMLIAGGGTGGHLFPGIALAEEVTTRHPDNQVLFVGTTRGLEARVVPAAGFPLETIQVRGLKGMGPLRALAGARAAPAVLPRQSWRSSGGSGPDVVVGVGGYASGPVVLAAWLRRHRHRHPGAERAPGRHQPDPREDRAGGVHRLRAGARRVSRGGRRTWSATPIRRKLMDNYLRSRPPVARRSASACWWSAARSARAGSTPRMLEALHHLADLQRAHGHRATRPGTTDLERVRAGYAAAGLRRPRWCEFIDDMSAAYARAVAGPLPRRGDHAGRAHRLQEGVDPRSLPVRHRRPPGGQRRGAGGGGRGADVPRGGADRRAAGAASSARWRRSRTTLQQMEKRRGTARAPRGRQELADVCAELVRPPPGGGADRWCRR